MCNNGQGKPFCLCAYWYMSRLVPGVYRGSDVRGQGSTLCIDC